MRTSGVVRRRTAQLIFARKPKGKDSSSKRPTAGFGKVAPEHLNPPVAWSCLPDAQKAANGCVGSLRRSLQASFNPLSSLGPRYVGSLPHSDTQIGNLRRHRGISFPIKLAAMRAFPRNPANPARRLSQISRQLSEQHPTSASYSASRLADTPDPSKDQQRALSTSSRSNMSSQPPHSTLLIPGPIEFDDAVLQSMGHYSESHVGPGFVATFGETLSMLRKLFQTSDPASQPFVISGSGTLGWDLVAANLAEPGDDVLVLTTGYFSDGFADCFRIYGANPTQLKAPVGSRPQLPEIEKALSEKKYKIITVTHVDTSTGVLSELKELSELVHRVSPDTLIIVDGVCSVACEEIAFDEWKLDGVVTASQKAIGCPAGLSISMFSGRAIQAFQNRKSEPRSYFASMKNWTPIMKNYEAKKPSYFATPSPQLVHALHTALTQILARPLSERFAKHKEASDRIKGAVADLGLKQVAANPADQAHGMTTIYLPDQVKATELLPSLAKKGVVFAGGIHKEIAAKYIRLGHMGVSVTQPERGDLDKAIKALQDGLSECGYQKA